MLLKRKIPGVRFPWKSGANNVSDVDSFSLKPFLEKGLFWTHNLSVSERLRMINTLNRPRLNHRVFLYSRSLYQVELPGDNSIINRGRI